MPVTTQTTTKAAKARAIKALERNGVIRTEDLIRAARAPDHPCHGDFTWDIDAAAAERWHDQARKLIRSFRFEVEIVDSPPSHVVYYVPSAGNGGSFRSLPSVRRSADVNTLIRDELRQLVGHVSRVLGIAEAKRGHVGDEFISSLRRVRDSLAGMVEE